ncbi:MAG: SurA N-terminal domain-containing protein [Pseudomonadales bacterium]
MLQKMRDQTQSTAFKVVVALIVFVLAVFGFGSFNLFVTGDPDIASVNGEGITQSMLQNETERERRRIAAQLGGNFDESLIDPLQLQNMVLERMIARSVLQQAAEDLKVGASRAQVDAAVLRNPTFQLDGHFDEGQYRRMVQFLGFTPKGFLDEMGDNLALQQLQQSVGDTAIVTEQELRMQARLLNQRRDVAYLPFTLEDFTARVSVSDEDVATRYEENQRQYMTEETADAQYVELSWRDLVDDPSISVSEDDLHAAWEADKAQAESEEQRRARHILIAVSDARSDEAAAELAGEIKARIDKGEAFDALAREFSDDPGSAEQGGELGFAGRGVYDPQFEAALYALSDGEVSDPVRTPFGYHVIQLEEVRSTEYPDFETARADIEQRLRREQAEALFAERQRELDSLAFERPESLQPIAEELGLEIRTADGVSRSSGTGPFAEQAVRDALFATEVLDDGYNSAAVASGENSAVVVRALARHAPEPIPLAQVADQIRSEIATERARVMLEEAQASALARLQAGESVSDVAQDAGVQWQTYSQVLRRASQVPAPVLQTAFTLPRPPEGGRSVGSADLGDGTLAVVTVTRVEDGNVDSVPESELAQMRRFLADRSSRLDFDGYFESLRQDASVKRPSS